MHLVANRNSNQWLQKLEFYFSSLTRRSETGSQADPAAQRRNQRPDSSCFAALPSLTFVFPASCHDTAAPLGFISEL